MRISAPHPTISEPSTYLTANATAGDTSITVANTNGFATSNYVVIGKPGDETSSIHKLSGITPSTSILLTGDTLDFSYSSNTPVSYIKYNQARFYLGDYSSGYSTGTVSISKDSAVLTGTGTSWGSIDTTYALLLNGKWYDIKSQDSATQLTLEENYVDEDIEGQSYILVPFTLQETLDIAVDQLFTVWDDIDAQEEDYYRTEYFNSTNSSTSAKSSIVSARAVEGFSEFSLRALEDAVLSELRDPDGIRRTREEIDRDLNDALRDVANTVVSTVKEDYLGTKTTMDLIAGVDEYPLPDDFRKTTSVQISYDGGSTYRRAQMMSIGDEYPSYTYANSQPYYYLRDNMIGVRPEPSTASANGIKIWYDRRVPTLRYEGDELPHMFRDFRRMFIDYALEKASMSEDNANIAVTYKAAFEAAKRMLVNSMKTRDRTTNNRVQITNDRDLYDL